MADTLTDAQPGALDLLVASATALWNAVLIGNPPPATRRTYERMRHPRLGDWVLVRDGFAEPASQRVGRLVSCWSRLLDWDTDDRWHDGPIWMVELLDGSTINWGNCDLIAIPPFPA